MEPSSRLIMRFSPRHGRHQWLSHSYPSFSTSNCTTSSPTYASLLDCKSTLGTVPTVTRLLRSLITARPSKTSSTKELRDLIDNGRTSAQLAPCHRINFGPPLQIRRSEQSTPPMRKTESVHKDFPKFPYDPEKIASPTVQLVSVHLIRHRYQSYSPHQRT